MTVLLVILYIAVAAVVTGIYYGTKDPVMAEDVDFHSFIGFLAGLLWPVTAVIWAILRLLHLGIWIATRKFR